jgi:hypothetical protein
MARERFVRRGGTLAMHRHGRNIPGGMSAQNRNGVAYSLNVAPTFVKCALGRVPLIPLPAPPPPSPPPPPPLPSNGPDGSRRAGRLSRARNYSQFRVNESKTIRIAARKRRASERERKRLRVGECEGAREEEREGGNAGEREREREGEREGEGEG